MEACPSEHAIAAQKPHNGIDASLGVALTTGVVPRAIRFAHPNEPAHAHTTQAPLTRATSTAEDRINNSDRPSGIASACG